MLTRKSVAEIDGQSQWSWSQPLRAYIHRIALNRVHTHIHPSQVSRKRPTLNCSLGTDRGSQTHSTGHEVREDLVAARGIARGVFAEVGDLHGGTTLVSAGEGALEGRLRIGDSPPLLAGGDGGAGGGQLLTSAGAQQSARGGGERHGGN